MIVTKSFGSLHVCVCVRVSERWKMERQRQIEAAPECIHVRTGPPESNGAQDSEDERK